MIGFVYIIDYGNYILYPKKAGKTVDAPIRNRHAPTTIMISFLTPSSPEFIFMYIWSAE